ncbi:MAG: hypothetical protein GX162_00955 [Firmicutes bacterium]|jgi:uncharacterized protein YegP (UPF0339 family)|nr:hypothetical protein [Bacillota bacterium]
MKRPIVSLLGSLLIAVLAVGLVWAADPSEALTQVPQEVKQGQGTPKKEHQFVWSLSPWTGKEFGGSFAPRQVDTIYLLADETNIMNSLRSEIYFWEITQEYMADWFGTKEEVDGTLEILKGNTVFKTVEKIPYVYSYPEGYYGRVELITGPEAHEAFERYEKLQDDYYDAVSAYYDAQSKWQEKMDKLLERVRKTGEYAKPEEIPASPQQPEAPKLYVTSPVEAFVFELPEGKYRIRLVDPNGEVVPETQKNLVVFAPRRAGVGYEIIPESKWTRPVLSDDNSHVLYLEGRRTFYLKPSHELEYNQYQYLKMSSLHKPLEGLGTRSAWMWVHTKEIVDAKIQILKDGEVIQTIERKPYYVEQTPGYALGYSIVEVTEDSDREPTFEAFKIDLEAKGKYVMRLIDLNGEVVPGSERVIRSVRVASWPLYTVPLIPLLVGLAVVAWRRSLKSDIPEGMETRVATER